MGGGSIPSTPSPGVAISKIGLRGSLQESNSCRQHRGSLIRLFHGGTEREPLQALNLAGLAIRRACDSEAHDSHETKARFPHKVILNK